MFVFGDSTHGMLFVADPPQGVPLPAILSQAISAALSSPVPLPLDALLVASTAAWDTIQAALLNGTGTAFLPTYASHFICMHQHTSHCKG